MTSHDREVEAFGPFEYRRQSVELYRAGQRVDAPSRALAVLARLLDGRGELVTKEELLASAWKGTHVTAKSLPEAVSRLRAALGDDAAAPRFVETLPGRGYRFVAEVRPGGSRARRIAPGRRWRPSATGSLVTGSAVAAAALVALAWWPPASGAAAPVAARLSSRGEVVSSLDHLPFTVRDVVASPDGRRLALNVGDADRGEIWITDSAGETLRRLSEDGSSFEPVFSPDGLWVAWASKAGGTFDIVRRPAGGGGEVEVLLEAPGDQYPESWSADGGRLVYSETGLGRGFDLAVLERGATGGWVPRQLAATRHDEYLGSFSPDGRWLSYESNRTGRPEIWVEPADGSRRAVQVSRAGGRSPFWTADGASLYYLERGRLVRTERLGGSAAPSRPLALPGGMAILRVRAAADGFVAILERRG